MRIALCGPGGSGKTILAQRLSKKLDLSILPSAMRITIEAMGLVTSELAELPKKDRIALQTRALFTHIMNEHAARGGFVSDRTRADFETYMATFLGEDSEEMAWYRKITAMANAVTYTHVFYVPPFSDEPPPDGVRYTGKSAWVEDSVRKSMLDVVLSHYPGAIVLQSKDINDRIGEIVREINAQ